MMMMENQPPVSSLLVPILSDSNKHKLRKMLLLLLASEVLQVPKWPAANPIYSKLRTEITLHLGAYENTAGWHASTAKNLL